MSANRNTAKDAMAWTILHGGYFAAKTTLTTVGVAAGLIDKCMAKNITKMVGKMAPHLKKIAWKHYEETGNIWEMVQLAAGGQL